jgi:hypothetical protein
MKILGQCHQQTAQVKTFPFLKWLVQINFHRQERRNRLDCSRSHGIESLNGYVGDIRESSGYSDIRPQHAHGQLY